MRGEQHPCAYVDVSDLGSPPLARGTDIISFNRFKLHGITPACAGNSLNNATKPELGGDHPRLRGEQIIQHYLLQSIGGSPPLARGTALNNVNNLNYAGITPACAGNSITFSIFKFFI